MAWKTAAKAASVCSSAAFKKPGARRMPSGGLGFWRERTNSWGVSRTLPKATTSHSKNEPSLAGTGGEGNGFKRHESFRSQERPQGAEPPPVKQIGTSN